MQSATEQQRNLSLEATKRLEQLSYLLERLYKLEQRMRVQIQRDFPTMVTAKILSNKFFKKQEIVGKQIEIYTEAFYYLAFRLRAIIKLLPNLKSFEAMGILIVRNKLIEHSQGQDSLITDSSFGHIGSNGPQVKPARSHGTIGKFMDKGLYANAEELINNLNNKLTPLIK
jgi:hypothetical protein